MAIKTPKPHYHGHRDRLRERFAKGGPDALADYELLELYLFNSIRMGDVKPIAKDLIAKFGSFAEAVAAPVERLVEVKGVGPKTALDLQIIKAAATKLGQESILGRPVLSSWTALLDYCRSAMQFEGKEQFRSQSDIDMTKEIVQACKGIRVAVHDHLIIGRENIASFKTLGLM